ncbi:germin-like protein 6a [Panicum miliaceum]|uniref:Germin-like protein n=1 Tax=Panicum miliaceum TaxID=4540 RepID=A0A3L6R1D2_PANMI|nr:germin-like protein 6a [Panicum miliaceum]
MAPGFLTPVSWSVRGGSGACPQRRVRQQQVNAAQISVGKASYGGNGSTGGTGSPSSSLDFPRADAKQEKTRDWSRHTPHTASDQTLTRRRLHVQGSPRPTTSSPTSSHSPPPNGGGGTRATGPVPAVGSVVTDANVTVVPGLNTQGVSLSRTDFAPGGLNPPHTHPRASEIIFVLAGTLDVGFITTANVLFAKTISASQLFVFPRGLVHFQSNPGNLSAAAISAFNSQLPGTQFIPSTLFRASPDVPTDVLAKAFRVGTAVVDGIKASF